MKSSDFCFIASDGKKVTVADQEVVHLMDERRDVYNDAGELLGMSYGPRCNPSAKFALGIALMFAGKLVCPQCLALHNTEIGN